MSISSTKSQRQTDVETTSKFQVESTNTVSTLFPRLDANVEPTFAKRRQNNVDITLSTFSTYFQPNFDVETTSYARWVGTLDQYFGHLVQYFGHLVQYIGTLVQYFGTLVQYFGHLVQYIGTLVQYFGTLVQYFGHLVQYFGHLVQYFGTLVQYFGT